MGKYNASLPPLSCTQGRGVSCLVSPLTFSVFIMVTLPNIQCISLPFSSLLDLQEVNITYLSNFSFTTDYKNCFTFF